MQPDGGSQKLRHTSSSTRNLQAYVAYPRLGIKFRAKFSGRPPSFARVQDRGDVAQPARFGAVPIEASRLSQ